MAYPPEFLKLVDEFIYLANRLANKFHGVVAAVVGALSGWAKARRNY